MKTNKIFIMIRFSLTGIYNTYYSEAFINSYDMYLVGKLLSYLRIENQNREFIMHELRTKKFISVANDFEYFAGRYNLETNILKIGGEYADFMDQAYFESCFPVEKLKDFLEYEYSIPLDDFLELAEKMKTFFDERIEWIILYEDEFGKVQLEQYYRQDEPQPS